MSYNGSGTFQINTSGQPVVTGTVISSTAFNSLTSDLATGLSTAITKDGQTTTTARITFAQGITSSLVTDSSSVSTGSIITAGGAGIAKNLYVGGIASFSAQPIFTSLTASSAVATDASKGLVSVTNTGTGNNVLATSPTIATPTISSLSSASATALTLQSAGTTAITVDTSQNVGIGTTSPIKKFVVSNAGAAGIELDPAASTGVTETIYYNRSTSAYITNRQTALAHQFYAGTSPASALTVDSSGNLLVGVATTITSKYTVTVSTSATTISSFASDYGQMVIVSGNSSGNIFSDLLFSCTTAGPTVLSSKTISGAPVARTYTMNSGYLQLAMASGTYAIWCAQYVGK